MHVLTVGASNQPMDDLAGLLRRHSVTAVADVRSIPMSRHTPQFNRPALKSGLSKLGIRYVFLGKELGARSSNPDCYVNGRVQYARLARTPEFQLGLSRIVDGASRECIAVLCTEQDPLDCHRSVLVAPALIQRGVEVSHIHRNGRIETHDVAMHRLRALHGLDQPSLLDSEEELVTRALVLQEEKIAYVNEELRTV